jgi:hypothetical protein
MSQIHPHTLEVLMTLYLNPQSTSKEMQARLPHVHDVAKILYGQATVGNAFAEPGESKQSLWTITAAGKRKVKFPQGGKGEMPAPREQYTTEPWKPSPWVPVRAGAQEHLQHPSRRGDALVPHTRMQSMAGKTSPIPWELGL